MSRSWNKNNGNKEKYGAQHRAARTQKLNSMLTQQCEVTAQTRRLTAHHNVPRLYNGPDIPENYMILSASFHEYLHSVCNTDNPELIGKRLELTDYIKKHILDDELRTHAVQQLDDIDMTIMTEYINNLITKVAKNFNDIIFLTILSNFRTIRNQAIKIWELESKAKTIEVD